MLRKLLIPLIALSLFALGAEKKVNTISCEPSLVYKCTLQGCEKIKVVNIDEADIQHFEIDLEKRSITGKIGNATVDTAVTLDTAAAVNGVAAAFGVQEMKQALMSAGKSSCENWWKNGRKTGSWRRACPWSLICVRRV